MEMTKLICVRRSGKSIMAEMVAELNHERHVVIGKAPDKIIVDELVDVPEIAEHHDSKNNTAQWKRERRGRGGRR